MSNLRRYVAGFMFEDEGVWLVLKNRPEWQAGKLNGIGGHIEHGEHADKAMVREFHEETGCQTSESDWTCFAVLRGVDYEVFFFHARFDRWTMLRPRTMESEAIALIRLADVNATVCIPNLTWLIPMAKSMSVETARSFVVHESTRRLEA